MNGSLALVWLVFTGVGVGAFVVPARPAHWPRAAWFALAALMGLLLIATLANALGVYGVPRAVVQIYAYGAAALGWFPWCRRARAPAVVPRREDWGMVLAVAFLTFVPWAAALSGPAFVHDAASIWYFKILDILGNVTPTPEEIAAGWPTHAHALYPRGLAWLAVLGDPAGTADPSIPRVVSLLFPTMGSLVLGGWFLARRRFGLGLLAVVLCLSIPESAVQMAIGMADLPLAFALLVTVIGLAFARGADPNFSDRSAVRFGRLAAAIGAAGAASIKQEGAVIAGAVALYLIVGIVRGPRGDRWHWALCLAVIATLLPWWNLRSHGDPEVLADAELATNPIFLSGRVALLTKKLFYQMFDPAQLDPLGGPPTHAPIVSWVLALGLMFLLLFRRRPVPIWPALCLLAADIAVYVITIHDLTWHILTSADRLWMQLTPALIFAVFAAAAAATEPRTPS